MTKRWIVSGVAVVALLGATAGIAYAAGSGSAGASTPGANGLMTACAAMHDTPAMEAMHEHMPAALQAQCDAIHEQMVGMMGDSGMMDGSGMMGGGSMADHHPSTEG